MTREQIVDQFERMQKDLHAIEKALLGEVNRYLQSNDGTCEPKGRADRLMWLSFIDLANIVALSILLDDPGAREQLLSCIDTLRDNVADPERANSWREHMIALFSQSIVPSSQRPS